MTSMHVSVAHVDWLELRHFVDSRQHRVWLRASAGSGHSRLIAGSRDEWPQRVESLTECDIYDMPIICMRTNPLESAEEAWMRDMTGGAITAREISRLRVGSALIISSQLPPQLYSAEGCHMARLSRQRQPRRRCKI